MTKHLATLLALSLCAAPLYAETPIETCKKLFEEGTYSQAIPSCTQAAETNDRPSQTMLGEIYDEQKNSEQAALWWNKAAEAGYQPARNLLALKYYYGGTVFGPQKGWIKDQDKAFGIWLKDAEQDIATSQFMIGIMYQKGEGVTKNPAEAWFWLKRALGNGYKLATDVLIEVSRKISPEQKRSAEQRLAAYQKEKMGKK